MICPLGGSDQWASIWTSQAHKMDWKICLTYCQLIVHDLSIGGSDQWGLICPPQAQRGLYYSQKMSFLKTWYFTQRIRLHDLSIGGSDQWASIWTSQAHKMDWKICLTYCQLIVHDLSTGGSDQWGLICPSQAQRGLYYSQKLSFLKTWYYTQRIAHCHFPNEV